MHPRLLQHRPAAAHGVGHPRPTTLSAVSAPSSGARPVQSSAQPEERGGNGGSASPPPTTQVAPASDLQSRQLRLLPWQTSASLGAGAASASGDGSGNSSSDAGVVARPASSRVASAKAQQQRTRAAGGAPLSTAGLPAGSSSSSSSSSGAQASGSSNSSGIGSSPAGVRGPAPRSGALCEACGGKRFLVSTRGAQPCYQCQQWRQSPDYRPGGALLSLQDVDLAGLEPGNSSSSSSSSGGGGGPGGSSGPGSEPAKAVAAGAAAATAGGVADSGSDDDGGPVRRRRSNYGKKSGPMSDERKAAISRALQSKGAKSEEHKRSISRAMREAHARNPRLRHVSAGHKKKCGHCGEVGHNRRACPQLLAAARAVSASLQAAKEKQMGVVRPAVAGMEASHSRMIMIEEVEDSLQAQQPAQGAAAAAAEPAAAAAVAEAAGAVLDGEAAPSSSSSSSAAPAAASDEGPTHVPERAAGAAMAAGASTAGPASSSSGSRSSRVDSTEGVLAPVAGQASVAAAGVLSTLQLGPTLALCPDGSWVFPVPQSAEECVAQAAQACLRAWDDGLRRQSVELLLPQAGATEDGGWPGGIRQQFRVAKPMVESLLMRLKQHVGLEGRITAELLDEGDCVGAWQSERLGAVLFATADTLPELRRIDDALSGKRLTLVVNPQWQTQGQVISDFGIGQARKNAERFVAAFEEVYYFRRVRIMGDDVRLMRCYPGQWQVHYVPSDPRQETVLLSCEDGKPTFQRLIDLLKRVQGSRASKSWLDRFLTSSMGNFNESAAYSPESAADTAAGTAGSAALDGATQAGVEEQPGPAAAAAAAAAVEPPGLRDIVTGELLAPSAVKTSIAELGMQQGGPAGNPVRDIRMEPVNQIARWLGSQPDPASQQMRPPRRRPPGAGGSSGPKQGGDPGAGGSAA